MSTFDNAVRSLTSVPVLLFVLGVIGTRLRADLRLPEPVYVATAMYLLVAIGLKGGLGLRSTTVSQFAVPALVTVVLGVLTPLLAFALAGVFTRLDRIDRAALAAHYGSTSLVTFTAALLFLDGIGQTYEPFMATLLALLEVPGIVVALYLAGATSAASRREGLREVLTGRSVMLLGGGLIVGFVSGPAGWEKVEPFFGALFQGVLALFLLEMGVLVGRRLGDARRAGFGLVALALAMPLIGGSIGTLAGHYAGLSIGGATVLGTLVASASYIAAPAAVRLALPQANPAYYLTASLAVTFPFNLALGIPLYFTIARTLGS